MSMSKFLSKPAPKSGTPLGLAVAAIRPAVVATFSLGIFVNLLMLVSPIYSMQVYDRVLSSRNPTTLALLTVLAIGLLAVYGVLEHARTGILQRAGVRFDEILARALLGTAMRSEALRQKGSGAQALRDADTIRDFVAGGLIAALSDIPWVPVFMALCFVLHPMLGLVALGGAALVALLAFITEWSTKSQLDEANRAAGDVARMTGAFLRNSEVIRGLGMGEAVLARWREGQLARFTALIAAGDRNGALLATTKFIRMTIQIALLCTGAWLSLSGAISPGSMLAASILMGRALAPVEQAVGQWKRIIATRTALQRLEAFFAANPEPAQPLVLPEPKGAIAVEGLVVAPPGAAQPAVRGVSFELVAGESLAVIGPSASGKSSLARALTGVWPAVRGAVRIDGAALEQWDAGQIGRAMGYLPQDIELFAGTVAENIARLGVGDDAAVTGAAIAAGAHEAILRLPEGYATRIGDGGTGLSGGMRQRVGLARALYGSPRLVVLDEPNSNLDAAGEQALAEALAGLKTKGATVIVVTHRPQLLRYVDKVLIMAEGQVQAFGPRDKVLAELNGARPPQSAQPTRATPQRRTSEGTAVAARQTA